MNISSAMLSVYKQQCRETTKLDRSMGRKKDLSGIKLQGHCWWGGSKEKSKMVEETVNRVEIGAD